MQVKKRMITSEFEAIRQLLTISDNRADMAKLRLVDGLTYPAIAQKYGCSRQAVSDAVNVMWGKLQDYRAAQQTEATLNAAVIIPEGWEQVTLIAPSFLVAKLKVEIAELSTWNGKKTKVKK